MMTYEYEMSGDTSFVTYFTCIVSVQLTDPRALQQEVVATDSTIKCFHFIAAQINSSVFQYVTSL